VQKTFLKTTKTKKRQIWSLPISAGRGFLESQTKNIALCFLFSKNFSNFYFCRRSLVKIFSGKTFKLDPNWTVSADHVTRAVSRFQVADKCKNGKILKSIICAQKLQ